MVEYGGISGEKGKLLLYVCFSELVNNEVKSAIIYIRIVKPACDYERSFNTNGLKAKTA